MEPNKFKIAGLTVFCCQIVVIILLILTIDNIENAIEFLWGLLVVSAITFLILAYFDNKEH